MYQNHRIIAYIPARGGSKGIPGKNIIPLAGKPLIAYSIEVAKACPYIDYIHVSTDSETIASVAKEYGASVPFLRPAQYATDQSRTIDAMLYDLHTLASQGNSFDSIMLLQPTQPIRTPELLTNAIETFYKNNTTPLVSVCEVEEHPILMRTIQNGRLQSILNTGSTVRRQDFPTVYKVNGSIYLNRIDEHLNTDTSLNDNELPFIMDRSYSIDIDTLEDLHRAEEFLTNAR